MEKNILDMHCELCREETQVMYNIMDVDGRIKRLCWNCVRTEFIAQWECQRGITALNLKED